MLIKINKEFSIWKMNKKIVFINSSNTDLEEKDSQINSDLNLVNTTFDDAQKLIYSVTNENYEVKYHQQKRLIDQLMHALARVADENGKYTKEHSERVALYSMEIARRMGKSRKEQYEIYQMGLLHDIGKIGIPDSITAKPEGLQDDE